MRKLFTLLTLLVVCLTGAWAADTETTTATLKDWTTNTGTGGTVTWESENTVAVINCGSTKGNAVTLTSDRSYGEISKIEFTTYVSGRDKTDLKIEIGTISNGVFIASQTFSSTYDSDAKKLSLGTLNVTKNSTNTTGAVTPSPACTGYVRLTMANASESSGKTGKFLNIKITSKPRTLTSATLTGIKINGSSWNISNLNGSQATIATEYAGPPTVQFIYTAEYEGGSSETGKTQDIVAVKSGSNYVATSTVFTDAVSITFTNVSNTLFSMSDPTDPTADLDSKTNSPVTATFSPGGSAIVYNGHGSSATKLVVNGQINLGGSGNSYYQPSFAATLAEGDVITSSNTDASTFKIGVTTTSGSATAIEFPYTIPSGSNLIGNKTFYVFKTGTSGTSPTFDSFTITRPKTIDSQDLGGVKKGETTLAETTDYVVNGTTITLTDAHKAIVAPTDFKLINHITYDDASTEDKDVSVELTQNEDFFEGSTNIGTTTYTVKVPVDASTPLLSLSSASGSITLNSYTPTGTAKVTVTGANLTNGTFNAPTADGVTISPASVEITDGSLNQEFTITSTATTVANTVLNFAYEGAETQIYTLTYSKTAKRDLSQTDVTVATTWDWSKSGGAHIELTENTDPANGAEFLLAALPDISNDETFNSQALKVACQWPNRIPDNYFQGNTIKFNVTVPGTVQVWFSNTSNREDNAKNRRFLYVNGTNSDVYTLNQTFTQTEPMPVSAGEVVINAYTGEDTPIPTMVRINKIVFTPAAASVSVGSKGFATYCNADYALDFTGKSIEAYTVSSNGGTSLVLTKKDKVAKGEPVLLYSKTASDSQMIPAIADNEATVDENNKLKAGNGTAITWADNNPVYILYTSGATPGFYRANNSTVAAGKAYLDLNGTAEARAVSFSLNFDDVTAISEVATEVGDESACAPVYDLQGRRVAQPAKGLYIVNGKKVIIK